MSQDRERPPWAQNKTKEAQDRADRMIRQVRSIFTNHFTLDFFIYFVARQIVIDDQSVRVHLWDPQERRKTLNEETALILSVLDDQKSQIQEEMKRTYLDKEQTIFLIIGEARLAAGDFFRQCKNKGGLQEFQLKWGPVFQRLSDEIRSPSALPTLGE